MSLPHSYVEGLILNVTVFGSERGNSQEGIHEFSFQTSFTPLLVFPASGNGSTFCRIIYVRNRRLILSAFSPYTFACHRNHFITKLCWFHFLNIPHLCLLHLNHLHQYSCTTITISLDQIP